MLGHHFWSRVFKEEFVPQLRAIYEVLERRTLPAFDDIDREAATISEKAWDGFMSGLETGEEDPSEFVDAAQQAGVSHYVLWNGIRQGIINLFAAALYHPFEQQLMLFHRREILRSHEANNPNLFSINECQKRLDGLGICISQFSSWDAVNELRLVANTVKHAEGDSADKLYKLRPDLFENPDIRGMGFSIDKSSPRVYQPLVGEDLYVSLDDVSHYRISVISFWNELGEAMARAEN
jgi:hypothetical protein